MRTGGWEVLDKMVQNKMKKVIRWRKFVFRFYSVKLKKSEENKFL